MGRLSVSEAAGILGVNVKRVHQRIADGSLSAERVGHQWVIEEADLARLDRRPAGRPLSARSAWALAVAAALDDVRSSAPHDALLNPPEANEQMASPGIAPPERSRARARLRRLLSQALEHNDGESDSTDLAANLRSLLRNRADRRLYRASPRDLADLRSDDRINLSGISLAASGISSGDIVEGYVEVSHLPALVDGFLLSEARPGDANVVLHVVEPELIPDRRVEPDNWLLLAADLAEHQRPREIARASQIVRQVADQHPALVSR